MWGGKTTEEEAVSEAQLWRARHERIAQFFFSRCQHHTHPKNERGDRVPLTACKQKGTKGVKKDLTCKHGFPKSTENHIRCKVICNGVVAKHALKALGRKGCLGAILGERDDEWHTVTTASLAVCFQSNTNTCIVDRLPIIRETHDKECVMDCVKQHSTRHICEKGQRDQMRTANYLTSYFSKRQLVGKYEVSKCIEGLEYLGARMQEQSVGAQVQRTTHRLLTNMECRGTLRTAQGIFHLAVRSTPGRRFRC